MGKRKAAVAVGLCVAIGLCGAGLAACGNKGGGNTPSHKAGDKSEYYAIGVFQADSLKEYSGWTTKATLAEVPDELAFKYTDTKGQYTITLPLYKGDEFKTVQVGKGWDVKFTGDKIDASMTDGFIKGGGGTTADDWNLQIQKDGLYTFTLTISDDGSKYTYTRDDDVTPLPNPVQSVKLNAEKVVLFLETEGRDTFQLEHTIKPNDADEKDEFYYDSDNEDVATVSETGLITAVAKGEADITFECGGKTATCHVVVYNADDLIPATSVELDKTEATLHVGQNDTLTATVAPEETTDVANWTSSNDAVATVNSDGKITAVAPGTAKITVTYGVGEDAVKAECEVTVPADYYLRGQNAANLFSWNAVATYDVASEKGIAFTKGATSYVLEDVNLYEGDEFKLALVGAAAADTSDEPSDWFGALTGTWEDLEEGVATIDVAVVDGGGNITIGTEGKYTLTLTIVKGEEGEEDTATLKFERTGDADPVPEIEMDIYIKGAIGDQEGWDHRFDDQYRFDYNETTKEYTYIIKVGGDDGETPASAFGLAVYTPDEHEGYGTWVGRENFGDADGNCNNLFGTTGDPQLPSVEGTYKLVVTKVDTSWVLNMFAVEEDA